LRNFFCWHVVHGLEAAPARTIRYFRSVAPSVAWFRAVLALATLTAVVPARVLVRAVAPGGLLHRHAANVRRVISGAGSRNAAGVRLSRHGISLCAATRARGRRSRRIARGVAGGAVRGNLALDGVEARLGTCTDEDAGSVATSQASPAVFTAQAVPSASLPVPHVATAALVSVQPLGHVVDGVVASPAV
jgi:hypothetical protein